jgi:hypothetical protein
MSTTRAQSCRCKTRSRSMELSTHGSTSTTATSPTGVEHRAATPSYKPRRVSSNGAAVTDGITPEIGEVG